MMDAELPSTRPYLVRALHEWCTDHGFTPYIVVAVDERVQVPKEYVRDGQIVLNVSFDATSGLRIDNDAVSFKARFGGVARDVRVPIEHVVAIYARENGQGMAFPAPAPAVGADGTEDSASQRLQIVTAEPGGGDTEPNAETPTPPDTHQGPGPRGGKRPTLTRVK
ncbi:ClpXP protease specificity-enhancing factor [Tepidimonas charontis]|uniref:Stringent starvation protein B n=1 Tax=Tepidimonas charontis TaxID=2267262 RepID=A0A554XJK6_9BURK|nr:ClpXP protease specificity-enhancing factor [Tepidimonas charontis]TSE36017.1 Stringent starvation protein B [Tepidimonas charontis]